MAWIYQFSTKKKQEMEKIVRDNFRMGLNYVRGGGGGAFKAEPHFSAIEFVKF